MIDRIKNLPVGDNARRFLETVQRWLAPALLRRRTFGVATIAIFMAIIYWGLLASDRYISEAKIVIERTDMAAGTAMDIGSLLTGATGGNRTDQMQLRSYLLSTDMLGKLDEKLGLRGHYSDSARDPLSRMWNKDAPQEWFHKHYLARTSVEFDDYSGVLVISAQAYDPKMAKAIASTLVQEGERYMNELGHAMAREQVAFLEGQVSEMAHKAMEKRKELLAFQNQKGILAPQSAAEALQGNIYRLDAQLSDMKARRSAMLGYLSAEAPSVVELEMQIRASEKQIQQEQGRLTSPKGQTLNSTTEEYQRMEFAAKFAEDVYKTGLVALEKGRLEALRTLKKIAVLQAPTLPQYPWEPRRLYNIVVFMLSAFILAGIVHLLAAVVRDHQD
ncbi:MAG: hypothetical protein WAV95_02940 [Azonexus sp.]